MDFRKSSLFFCLVFIVLHSYWDWSARKANQPRQLRSRWKINENTSHERRARSNNLSAEAVEGLALALEGVDDVHGGNRLAASVLGISDGVTDDIFEEHLEDATRLLVD